MSPEFSRDFQVKLTADEALCFVSVPQQPIAGAHQLCKVYEIDQRLGIVLEPQAASDNSPSKAFVQNRRLNCRFALDAVFRIMRVNTDYEVEFSTGWALCPPIEMEERYMFYAVCTAHTFNKPETASYFKGSFGQAAKPKNFRESGFSIDKDLVMCVWNDQADIAIVRCFIDKSKMHTIPGSSSTSFLLPCSPKVYGDVDAHLATFGYNGFKQFLEQAKKELLDDDEPVLDLWDTYCDAFDSKRQLYTTSMN